MLLATRLPTSIPDRRNGDNAIGHISPFSVDIAETAVRYEQRSAIMAEKKKTIGHTKLQLPWAPVLIITCYYTPCNLHHSSPIKEHYTDHFITSSTSPHVFTKSCCDRYLLLVADCHSQKAAAMAVLFYHPYLSSVLILFYNHNHLWIAIHKKNSCDGHVRSTEGYFITPDRSV